MHATIVDSPDSYGRIDHEELFWTYNLQAHAWHMYDIADGETSGEFGGVWWEGSSFTWHGSTFDMMSHISNEEIVWTRHGVSKFDWSSYGTIADGSRKLGSSAVCVLSKD